MLSDSYQVLYKRKPVQYAPRPPFVSNETEVSMGSIVNHAGLKRGEGMVHRGHRRSIHRLRGVSSPVSLRCIIHFVGCAQNIDIIGSTTTSKYAILLIFAVLPDH